VSQPESLEQKTLQDALAGLHHGDFSRLAPWFAPQADGRVAILDWVASGWFETDPIALNEALTCACFLGQTRVAEQLLAQGADLVRGNGTGLNGFHWAANRGKLETVRALISQGCPLEELSSYGGSVLGSAVWAAIHEPRPDHLAIIEALLQAGASVDGADYPSGDQAVDQLLQRYGAGS
jgi:hypothetical protein